MRGLVLLACLAVVCLAQRPRPCRSPPLLTGSLSMAAQSQKMTAYAKYSYDAVGQRIRLREIGFSDNETFHLDSLLLYREHVLYRINHHNRTCCKKRLRVDFLPLAVPKNASFLAQVVVGSSSGPGQGVWVNTWVGELQLKRTLKAKYITTVTEFECIPVSNLFHTDKGGWVITSFFNNVLGIEEPGQFIPPPFCKDAQLDEEDGEEPTDFYNLFFE